VVSEVVTPRAIRRASESTILWADDKPADNLHEREALEALGVNFVLCTSTEDAVERVTRESFDAIITDMSRPPDPTAGYALLDALRKLGVRTPVIIYTRSLVSRAEARNRALTGQNKSE